MVGNFNRIDDFKAGFEKKCIRLLVEAYNQSITEKSVKTDWNENDITGQLHKYIDINPLRAKWLISSNVDHHLPNVLQEKEKGYADKDFRVDLRFVKFQIRILSSNKEFTVFFEAKNLKANDSGLKRRYIDTGIGYFISRKYPHQFLIGYLLEGSVYSTVTEGINILLKKNNRENECLQVKKHEIAPYYFESYHSGLCLRHLIFDFTVL